MDNINTLLAYVLTHHNYIVIQCTDEYWERLTNEIYIPRLAYMFHIGNIKKIQKIPSEDLNVSFRLVREHSQRPTAAILITGANNWQRQTKLINFQLHPIKGEVFYYSVDLN